MNLPAEQYQQILERVPILCVDGIVLDQRGRFLLLKRRNAPRQGEWWVPGGRVLKGETLEAAFARRMREELGIDTPPEPFARFQSFNAWRAR